MPDSTKRSLHVLRDKGVKLFVATGRFPAMVTFMEAMFPFDGYVTMNGQLVVLADGSVIHRLGHHPEDIRRLDAVSRQKGFPRLIIEEDAYFYTVPSPEIDRHFISGHLPPPGRTYDPARLAEHPVLQFLIYSPEDLPALDALEHIEITSAGGSIFDIIPKTGGKQVGIRAAAEYFHIQREEVMVFGDGDNDVNCLPAGSLRRARAGAGALPYSCSHRSPRAYRGALSLPHGGAAQRICAGIPFLWGRRTDAGRDAL